MSIPFLSVRPGSDSDAASPMVVPLPEAKILYLPAPALVAAGLRQRFWAHAFDAVIVQGLSLYVANFAAVALTVGLMKTVPMGEGTTLADNQVLFMDILRMATGTVWIAAMFSVSAIYVLAFELLCGRTLGKAILGLRLVDTATGRRPSVRGLVWRYFAYVVSYFSFGLFFFQGAHDLWSGTHVVQD